ncbi:MAG: aminoacyl-tRNA hydrolase [Treponema sp.]|jgi:ribosome-associated protein|nr:aminoacyl-tRNA hydrolase [Treponema sp.]
MDLLLLRESIFNASKVSFSRSGGPGGQNVNKVNTKATLRLPLEDLAGLSDAEMARLREQLASRISGAAGKGELIITGSEERSQRINLERVYIRAEALITGAARLPKHRRPMKPSRAVKERRLKAKQIQGRKKAERRFLPGDP